MPLTARAIFRPRDDLGRFASVAITPGVVAAVTASVQLVQQLARDKCPVDTGALRESIQYRVDDSGKTVIGRVGPNMPYDVYVEFGTGIRGSSSAGAGPGPYSTTWPGMPAQPYMRPAVDEARDSILDLFRSNILISL